MKEIQFLHKNIKKWKEFEKIIEQNDFHDPDAIYEFYIHLTNDLAYAKTYFPNGEAEALLNQLTTRVHDIVYRNKPIDNKRVFRFWSRELPLVFHSIRHEFYVASGVFIVAILIGILSTYYQPDFSKTILGDRYVNMTLENIKNDDPMAVYKNMNEVPMFLGITINNVRVAFLAFVSGIITSLGTGYILFSNGVMLGTFFTFLGQNGVVLDAFATIWIHGTIEIFAIVVAGASGIHLGNSFLFPGTLKRIEAFKKAAQTAGKLALGLVPFFIIAGFLEGFVTRHTELPYSIRFGIIFLSLALIIYYFFIKPRISLKRIKLHENC